MTVRLGALQLLRSQPSEPAMVLALVRAVIALVVVFGAKLAPRQQPSGRVGAR